MALNPVGLEDLSSICETFLRRLAHVPSNRVGDFLICTTFRVMSKTFPSWNTLRRKAPSLVRTLPRASNNCSR